MAKTKKPGQNSAEIGFEKQIWDAANILRGNHRTKVRDANEYKHVILGLIFLKYMSDKFKVHYQTLKEAGYGFKGDKKAVGGDWV
jgi:type I restriction enzyme M protein